MDPVPLLLWETGSAGTSFPFLSSHGKEIPVVELNRKCSCVLILL